MFHQFREWFWQESFWLPPGFKWADVKNAPISTLYTAPFIAIILLIIRYLFERYIALNVCICIGIVGSSKKTEVNASDTEITAAANEKQSFRWFRKSRRYDVAAQFQKGNGNMLEMFCLLRVFCLWVVCDTWLSLVLE